MIGTITFLDATPDVVVQEPNTLEFTHFGMFVRDMASRNKIFYPMHTIKTLTYPDDTPESPSSGESGPL